MYFLLLILIPGQRILDPEVYPGCLQVHDYSISAYQGLPYMGLSENRVAHNPMVYERFPIKIDIDIWGITAQPLTKPWRGRAKLRLWCFSALGRAVLLWITLGGSSQGL